MQLAFSPTDRASISDERLADLLSAAAASLASDAVRSLYFANEALLFAESLNRPDSELLALKAVIAAIHADGRTADATPYLARAIALSEQTANREILDDLLAMVGRWAAEIEHEPTPGRSASRKRADATLPILISTIARLEQVRDDLPEVIDVAEMPAEPILIRRPDLAVSDPETGLLNARGMSIELLRLEDARLNYVLIQVAINERDADAFPALAQIVRAAVGDDGVIARNAEQTLTIMLPGSTGIAAMMLAEQLRTSILRSRETMPATVAIGVSIKQPGETSRDVLRRVVDRREEALQSGSVTVVG